MAFAETLSGYFTDFGSDALYNGASPVRVIFEASYLEPLGNEVEAAAPVAWVETALIPNVKQGDTLLVNAKHYTVRGVEPDGTGVSMLRLEEQ